MALLPPEKGWWHKSVAKDEKIWIACATVVALALFSLMVAWHVVGKQNPSYLVYKTSPDEFYKLAQANWEKYKVGEKNGMTVVKPPPDGEIFVMGSTWRWEPALILKKGAKYKFHISSMDLLHGFSLQPVNMNFKIHPGYDYVLTFTPTSTGTFNVICNEYCGPGHHTMITEITVED
ncbi:MAG: cytochrome C oxidase subunit II [Candidatus Magnetobacterium sp. LHC-1]|nr:cytochrome C oxidase subunit II [Nitrospirota bacterium]